MFTESCFSTEFFRILVLDREAGIFPVSYYCDAYVDCENSWDEGLECNPSLGTQTIQRTTRTQKRQKRITKKENIIFFLLRCYWFCLGGLWIGVGVIIGLCLIYIIICFGIVLSHWEHVRYPPKNSEFIFVLLRITCSFFFISNVVLAGGQTIHENFSPLHFGWRPSGSPSLCTTHRVQNRGALRNHVVVNW